ncbi:MAG: hypothetical protein VXY92_08465 [Planctomycetota bacterium]|nr:hypothetical protein [Planctomycetota bacterium]
MPLLALDGWIGQWSPGIGDPTVAGWVTVAAYFAAAATCWCARSQARRERAQGAGHASSRFWAAASVGLAARGLNKQLDLQTALTELGRVLAREQGWYEHRRVVQLAFILIVLSVVAVACRWLFRAAREDLSRLWLAMVGAAALCGFVAIRATSFHHVDVCLWVDLFCGLRMNVLLELSGIFCVGVSALRFGPAQVAESREGRE